MPSTAYLEGLPVEILERIFLELHYFDICSVKLVSGDANMPVFVMVNIRMSSQLNRFVNDVVKQSPLIQYHVQLSLYGFHDDFSGRSAGSVAARLDQLRTYWSRWSRLEPAETTVVELSGPLGKHQLLGGVFSIVVGEQRTRLRFIRLPSVSRGIAQEEWYLDNLQIPIDGYITDPSSDLLIVYQDQSIAHSR